MFILALLICCGSAAMAEDNAMEKYFKANRDKVYELIDSGTFDQAEKILEEMLNNKDFKAEYTGNSYAFIYNLYTEIYYRQEDYKQTLQYAQKSIESKPTSSANLATPWYFSFFSYVELGEYDKALDAAAKAKTLLTEIGNQTAVDRVNLILAEVEAKASQSVKDKYLNEVLDKVDQHFEKGYSSNDKASFQAALKILTEALNNNKYKALYTDDDKFNIYSGLAQANTSLFKTKESLEWADKALAINPTHEWTLFIKLAALVDANNYAEALELAQQAKPYLKDENRAAICAKVLLEYPAAINAKISPAALFKAFSDNEIRANSLYRGKPIALVGKITDIKESPMGYPELEFAIGNHGFNKVVCQFPKSALEQIAELTKGKQVVIIGTVKGLTLGVQVNVDNCHMAKLITP